MCVCVFFRKQKAAGDDNRFDPAQEPGTTQDQVLSSIISAGTSVTGNVSCEGDLLIEGTVRGAVSAVRLMVGLEGSIEGEITAEDVSVHGAVKGPVHARHIHLAAGCSVEGDLATATIAIDTGARLSGAVWQEQDEAPPAADAVVTPFAGSTWDGHLEEVPKPLAAVPLERSAR